MSEENVEVVRIPIAVRATSRRTVQERLAMRFPRALAFVVRAVLRFPLRSRLRLRLTRHAIRVGTEAINRGDFEASLGLYHPEAELLAPSKLATFGFEGATGPAERIDFQRRWMAEWGEFRFEPEEVLVFGDNRRFMMMGRMTGSGRSSGAAFGNEWAGLMTVSDGWLVREHVFFDHTEALEAVGLSEEA